MEMETDTVSNGSSLSSSSAATDISDRTDVSATLNITIPVPAAGTSSKLNQMKETLKLEHQFVRAPFEHFRKTIRSNHRIVGKEVSAVISAVSETADTPDLTRDHAVQQLNSIFSRLQGFKRKLEEDSKAENMQAQRCRARLDHLESVNLDNLPEWSDTRLKRILVDYMLRMSYYDTAKKIAESYNIQDLVDIDEFLEAKKVIESLENKEVGPALAWCADNKSKLKKSESKLEFELRLQEYIELVRDDNIMKAITYFRKHLAPWGDSHMHELQRVFATVAFKSSTDCATYKVLFEPKQWDVLVGLFKQEFYRLHGMTLEPLLNIFLQAGLTALKTPFCYEDDCTKEDPLSQESFRKLASQLPYSKQHNSKIVCYITKELMESNNEPLVLPNGYVYSTKALEEMAKENNGKITCPRTGKLKNNLWYMKTGAWPTASSSTTKRKEQPVLPIYPRDAYSHRCSPPPNQKNSPTTKMEDRPPTAPTKDQEKIQALSGSNRMIQILPPSTENELITMVGVGDLQEEEEGDA